MVTFTTYLEFGQDGNHGSGPVPIPDHITFDGGINETPGVVGYDAGATRDFQIGSSSPAYPGTLRTYYAWGTSQNTANHLTFTYMKFDNGAPTRVRCSDWGPVMPTRRSVRICSARRVAVLWGRRIRR